MEQSARKRAWDDTKMSFHSIKFFWVVEVVMMGIFVFLATLLIPENANAVITALYPAVGVVIGAIVGFGVIYLIMLIVAPYKQRNEARHLLSEIPSKRKVIADKLAEFYLAGEDLLASAIQNKLGGDALTLYGRWGNAVKDYFNANPNELGQAILFRIIPSINDLKVHIPDEFNMDEDTKYIYIMLSVETRKLKDVIEEFLK